MKRVYVTYKIISTAPAVLRRQRLRVVNALHIFAGQARDTTE